MVIDFLALLTIASNIVFVLILTALFINKLITPSFIGKNTARNLIKRYLLKFTLIISLVATSGSLYFSEVAGFEPCRLCWFQRILMYPLPIMMITALIGKYKGVFNYVLPLSFIGLSIAIYHYYNQVIGGSSLTCSVVGYSASCSERFFTYFGYITIPWMSFSAFTYIFLLGLIGKKTS